jgi:cell division protein FtsI/penicillin-binding protein 2
MASYISTVAAHGKRFRPHLTKSVLPPGEGAKARPVEPALMDTIDLDAEWWDRLTEALVAVVEGGTAKAARIPGVRVAGKTGSSEHRRGSRTHGWFVGFAPADNPRIAIAVVLEAAGHGGEVAVPVAKQVLEAYLRKPASSTPSSRALTASASEELDADR